MSRRNSPPLTATQAGGCLGPWHLAETQLTADLKEWAGEERCRNRSDERKLPAGCWLHRRRGVAYGRGTRGDGAWSPRAGLAFRFGRGETPGGPENGLAAHRRHLAGPIRSSSAGTEIKIARLKRRHQHDLLRPALAEFPGNEQTRLGLPERRFTSLRDPALAVASHQTSKK